MNLEHLPPAQRAMANLIIDNPQIVGRIPIEKASDPDVCNEMASSAIVHTREGNPQLNSRLAATCSELGGCSARTAFTTVLGKMTTIGA